MRGSRKSAQRSCGAPRVSAGALRRGGACNCTQPSSANSAACAQDNAGMRTCRPPEAARASQPEQAFRLWRTRCERGAERGGATVPACIRSRTAPKARRTSLRARCAHHATTRVAAWAASPRAHGAVSSHARSRR